jgi:hypothetical protein
MNVRKWNEVGNAYCRVKDARREIVFPFLWRRVRQLKAKTLLDFGGGDGSFACAKGKVARPEVIVYEPATSLRRIAKKRLARITKAEAIGKTELSKFSDFDVIVLNAVWMSMETQSQCLNMLGLIHEKLADHGVLLASVTHPCFRDVQFSTFKTTFDRTEYLHSGHPFRVEIYDGQNRVTLTDIHWTLSDMVGQLTASGFRIRQLWELADRTAVSKSAGAPWLVFECEQSRSPTATTRGSSLDIA